MRVDVRSVDGDAIRGALVELLRDDIGPSTKTGRSGTAKLRRLAVGPWTVRVQAPGHAREVREVSLEEDDTVVEIALSPGARIDGTLADEAGRPVASARVIGRPEVDLDSVWEVQSDPEGRFVLDTIPPGSWVVDVQASGFASAQRKVEVTIEEPQAIQVRLASAATLAGRVYGPSGAPLKGASVSVIGSRVWPARVVEANHEGRFIWEGIPPGIYEVRARQGSLISPLLEGLLLEPGETRVLSFRLTPGRSLKGRVIDAQSSQAIGNATISIGEGPIGLLSRSTQTDRDGRFVFYGVPNTELRVSVSSQGYVATPPRLYLPEETGILIALSKAASAVGRVVDEQGRGIAGARVAAVSVGTDPSPRPVLSADSLGVTGGAVPPISAALSGTPASASAMAETRSSRDGTFRLQGLRPGRFRLVASHSTYASGHSQALRLRGGAERAGIRLVLMRGGAIEGRVVDARGYGVASASIELRGDGDPLPRTVMSASDGTFEFQGVRGNVVVTARTSNQLATRKRVRIAEGDRVAVTLQLSASVSELRGRAVDDGGFPVERAQVTLISLRAGTKLRRTTFSDADGTFIFSGLPDPPYQLKAIHSEYSEAQVDRVSTTEAEVQVVLVQGISLQGRVVDDWTDEGVGGADLTLSGPGRFEATTDDDGGFSFRNVSVGAYTLQVRHPDYDVHEVPVAVEASRYSPQAASIDSIRLPPTGRIEGEVLDSEGEPVGGSEVAWGIKPMWSRKAKTDAQGKFVLRGVPPGQHPVTARHPNAGQVQSDRLVSVRPQDLTPGVYLRLPRSQTAEPLTDADERTGVAIELRQVEGEVQVARVLADSRAAGLLRQGDVLILIDDVPITSLGEAESLLAGVAGDEVVIVLNRDGRERTVVVQRERFSPVN